MLLFILLHSGCSSYAWLHDLCLGQALCLVRILVLGPPVLSALFWHQHVRGASCVGVHGMLQLHDVPSERGAVPVCRLLMFHGPIKEAVPFFEKLGFVCPERKDHASFLQEVTTAKGTPLESLCNCQRHASEVSH